MLQLLTKFVGLLVFGAQFAHALDAIEMKGQQFVNTRTNNRFVIVGIDYQPGGQSGYMPDKGVDPLSDGKACLRDAALLQKLGVNTIRVYNVAPEINHDECASIFNIAGIYMIIDVNSPFKGESLNRDNPGSSYTASYLERIFGVVENFKNYPNTLAFFAGNEVINDIATAKANPPYIRAIQRDLKQYIANNCDRSFPVGYSAADVREILGDTWQYFQCAIGGDASKDQTRSDFFGLNSYSWCGAVNTFTTSGYNDLASMFQDSSIPVFFSEYGCNKVLPRTFPEVPSLYGPNLTMLSGGLVYEYSQEPANYGLVVINDNSTVSLRVDYDNLQAQYNTLKLNLLRSTNSTAENIKPPTCSASLIQEGSFSKSFSIPNAPSGAVSMIKNGISNPHNGKVVQISNLNVQVAVYATNGSEITGLSVERVSDVNTPAGASFKSGSNSGSKTESSSNSRTSSPAMLLHPDAFVAGAGALLLGLLGL